jgi:quercetin dioxygenase-like cupin family protein
MFQVNAAEWLALTSQFVISKAGRGGRRYQHSGGKVPTSASPERMRTWQNPPYFAADNSTNRQEPIMAGRPKAVATIKIDEPNVRVTEFRFAPGAETGWHRHEYDYVVVPLLDGRLQLEEPGGTSRVAELHEHQPYTRLAGVEHNVINANAFEFAFLEVEHLR